jgi:tetratricopeptide (TPR) repeat protein
MRWAALAIVLACSCAAPNQSVTDGVPPNPDVSPLERKLAEHPDDPQVNLHLGEASEAAGDLLRAEQYYQRAEALGVPEDQMVPRLVRVLVAAHRYDEALTRCRRRLSAVPGDRATRYVMAALLTALSHPREAERELLALVRTKPSEAQAYLALGKLYRDELGDPPRAKTMFEKYLELAPDGEAAAGVRFELSDEAAANPPPPPPPPAPAPPSPGAPAAPQAAPTPIPLLPEASP